MLVDFCNPSSSDPGHDPRIARIPAGSISSTDAVSCGPVRVGFAGLLSLARCSPEGRNPPTSTRLGRRAATIRIRGWRRFRACQRDSVGPAAFAACRDETHDYPGSRCSHAPLVAEHVARARSGAKKPSLTLNGSDGRRCSETRTRTSITRTVAGPRCPRLLTCSPARDACSRRRGRRASCCCFPAKGYISSSLEVLSIHETPCGAALSTGCPQPVEEWRSPLFRA